MSNASGEQVVDHDAMTMEQKGELDKAGISSAPLSFRSPFGFVKLPKDKGDVAPNFMPAEHSYIGDSITLKLADNTTRTAKDYPFKLQNGSSLTYGQINTLAGDFYGTNQPISDGSDFQDQCRRFQRAYETLAQRPDRAPAEISKILGILQDEMKKIIEALKNKQDTSPIYNSLPNVDKALEEATSGRGSGIPSAFGLALINFDHFGADARVAYNAGHYVALQAAATGDLDLAYTMNAFCDHFLEDQFAAGHLRTPRRMCSGSKDKDFCSKAMHDEDNALGLDVKNRRGDSWKAFGDKRLGDSVDEDNLSYCVEAVQISANEIYECFKSKKVPPVSDFQVWQIAPTLESANTTSQACTALFRPEKDRREIINIRKSGRWTTNWTPLQTAIELFNHPRWKYPMQLDP